FDKKCGRENWTVAFAPDGSYFAWSQGHRVVKLVPWSQCLNNFTRIPRQNSDSSQKNKPREHIIDCGDIVWSLAFGSSVPEKQSRCVNIEWHRFKFGQDQLLLATGLNNGRIKIWDVYTGKLLLNLMDHTEVVRDLTFAPDGSLILVSASRDKTLRVWDLKDDGNMMKVLRGHQNWVYGCAFSPDSSILCSVGASKAVCVRVSCSLNLLNCGGSNIGVIEVKLAPLTQEHNGVSWAERVASLATRLGANFTIGRSNLAFDCKVYCTYAGAGLNVYSDGLLLCSSLFRMVRFWRIDEEYPVQVAPLNNGLCCTFSTDGSGIILVLWDFFVCVCRTQDGSVYFWATPRQVSSLQHLCRMAIRRVMPTSQVKNLPIPSKMVEFLCYQ
ncbi:WD repeat and SOCS box-containing protein 1, partial [Phaethon lepturus]